MVNETMGVQELAQGERRMRGAVIGPSLKEREVLKSFSHIRKKRIIPPAFLHQTPLMGSEPFILNSKALCAFQAE